MSVPVTSRLDETVVAALDQAVAAGLAPTRAGLIAAAVDEWLERHGEEAILASYRRRYAAADPEHDEVLAAFLRLAVESAAEEGLL